MKKAIFGGTFDPIHDAHTEVAKEALHAFELDEVIFMTAGDPYFKSGRRGITPAFLRYRMVCRAIDGISGLSASDLEIKRSGHTYTCDTLIELNRTEPDTDWYFIVGADCIATIHKWYRPDAIFENAAIIAANRNDQVPAQELYDAAARLKKDYNARIEILNWRGDAISSSDIRKKISEGCFDVPVSEPVKQLIRFNGLYSDIYDEASIIAGLKKLIKPARLEHTFGVAETAEKLAAFYDVPTYKARIAGLLHDCAKGESDALSHAGAGAIKAETEFKITDPEILEAIRWHTTGRPAMSMLEKIIFVSDYIEPGRNCASHLNELRESAYSDLDLTVRNISEYTLDYLHSRNEVIDGKTQEVYNYYNKIISER